MKYLLVGDIHFADRPPSSCTDTYLEDLFALMDQTVELETSLGCDGTIWAGDVFHVKAASRNSHRLVQRVIGLTARYKNLWIVPGNHDIEHDRIDSLLKQPLGTVFAAGYAKACHGINAPTGVIGVEWQQDWNDFYPPECLPEQLIVAHAPIYPERPVHDEFYSPEVWASRQGAGACYYGHVHSLHGAYQVRTGAASVWFCNQGAITRGSLHESDLLRHVAVTTWEPNLSGENPFTRIELVHKPATEVFRLADKAVLVDQSVRLEEFLASVGATDLRQVTVEAVMEKAREALSADEVALVFELLDSVS